MWYPRLARVTAVTTFVLLMAGASVTSTGSGLSVPDWPLSYGGLFPPMVGGILFEHGHRLIAGTVAILILALALLSRAGWPSAVRRLSWTAAILVLVQALLGGLAVLLRLPAAVSIAHACLALVVFSLVLGLAITTSRAWRESSAAGGAPLAGITLAATVAVGAQILLGAVMRHIGAGLACPDFPLCHGRLWPPITHPWIAVHFAHRLGALVVGALILALAAAARRGSVEVRGGAWLAAALLPLQLALGGAAVLSGLSAPITVAHHAVGALMLGCMVWTSLWARRRAGGVRREAAAPPVPAGTGARA